MQASLSTDAPDRCPECDATDWSDTPIQIDGLDGRMCLTCGRLERRCQSGHWIACDAVTTEGRCAACTARRFTLDDPEPIAAARWQLSHALGRLDAMRKYPETCPVTLEALAPIVAELEVTLRHIAEAHNG